MEDVSVMPHLSAIEWNNAAMAELKAHPSAPQCLFKDIGEFLKPQYKDIDGKDLLHASFGHNYFRSVFSLFMH